MKPTTTKVQIVFTDHAKERESERLSRTRREIVIDILKNLHKARKSKKDNTRYLIQGIHGQYIISRYGQVITVLGLDYLVE